jgi:hypothetical protein
VGLFESVAAPEMDAARRWDYFAGAQEQPQVQLHLQRSVAAHSHDAAHEQLGAHVQALVLATTAVSFDFVDIEHLVFGLTRCYRGIDRRS